MNAPTCDLDGRCGLAVRKIPCDMGRLAAELSIPESIRDEAKRICSAAVKSRLAPRKPLSVVAASSLYAACRENRMPIMLKELALASRSTQKEIGRSYRLIVSRLDTAPPVLNGTRYVERVAARVHASEEAKRQALEMERRAVDAGLGARNPMTLAAAAVYTACLNAGESKTQAEVAVAAGVTEVPVRECAKAVRKLVRLSNPAPQ